MALNYFLVILSALFYVLCLPPYFLWWLTPLLFFPLFIVIDKSNYYKTDFINGSLYGFFLYLFVFAWAPQSLSSLLSIPIVLSWALGLVLFILVGFLYGGLFCLTRFFWKKTPWLVILVWPGFEKVMLFGLPLSLGYAWVGSAGGIQIADLFGVYFLSALSCFYSYLIFYGYKNKNYRNKAWYLFFVVIIFHYGYGVYKTLKLNQQQAEKSIKVVLLQTGIDPILKRDEPEQTYQKVLKLLQKVASSSDEQTVLVLPESIFTKAFSAEDPRIVELYQQLKPKQRLIFGFNVVKDGQYYNSMGILVHSNELEKIAEKEQIIRSGELALVYYSKNNLLLFGEYFPIEQTVLYLFPSLKKIANMSHFQAGTKSLLLETKEFKIFPFICIESIYGSWIARENSRHKGSEILLNISEDGWFDNSHGSVLHSILLHFRAVEMRKPVLRCVNIGVCTALTESGSSLIKEDLKESSSIDSEHIYPLEVPINKNTSFYADYGYFFEYLVSIIFIVLTLKIVLADLLYVRYKKNKLQ